MWFKVINLFLKKNYVIYSSKPILKKGFDKTNFDQYVLLVIEIIANEIV